MKERFLGVDQTGAVNARGVPKPLPACMLEGSKFEFFALPHFSKTEVLKHEPSSAIIDCVLGMPRDLNLSFRQALKRLSGQETYGRVAAEQFFLQIGGGKIWHREVEVLAKANSLFRSRPFQKNIQTGTYRFWLDMARDPEWFCVPWLSGEAGRPGLKLFEGYPSLLWRKLFATPQRDPRQIEAWTKRLYKLKWGSSESRLVLKDPNFADALVLALGGRELLANETPARLDHEGWILGAD